MKNTVGRKHIFKKSMTSRTAAVYFLYLSDSIFSDKSWKQVVGKWKMEPKKLGWQVWWLYEGAWWGRKAKMLRYHQLGSVLSGPINSKPTFFPHILLVQRRPWHDKKANRRDKGTIGAKTCLQKRFCPTSFEVQKIRFLIKSGLCLYSELCFLCGRGAHSQKSSENKLSENEKWSPKRLDGKYDGYMRGLDGAEKRKCCKTIGFCMLHLVVASGVGQVPKRSFWREIPLVRLAK